MPTLRIKDLSEDSYLAFDLRDLLRVLGDATMDLWWKCTVDECIPVEGMPSLEDRFNKPAVIKGGDLLVLAASTRQVIDGIFEGFQSGSNIPWVKLEAIDSSYWEVTANDGVLERFHDHFHDVELVGRDAG